MPLACWVHTRSEMIWRSGSLAQMRGRSKLCLIENRTNKSLHKETTRKVSYSTLFLEQTVTLHYDSYLHSILNLDWSAELVRDAYQYGPIIGDIDLHLFREGQHWKIYEKFGAHLRTLGDATGAYFAVWAPNAQRVSVVGDFNDWDGRINPMRKLLTAGVWELFLPGIKQGAHYKFEIRTQTGAVILKSDPFAFFSQHGKSTASLVYDLERYAWSDEEWMKARQKRNWPQSPISIYEVHLG